VTAYLILGGVVLLVALISVGVAYFKGKRAGAATVKPVVTQHDVLAAEEVRKQVVEAQEEMTKLSIQVEARRAELERAMTLKNEAERLKALAELANKWKVPR